MSQEAYQTLKRLEKEGRIKIKYKINKTGGLDMFPFFYDQEPNQKNECFKAFLSSVREQKDEYFNIELDGSFYNALTKLRRKRK